MSFLPDELYVTIESSMPIACVDFVPLRRTLNVHEVGLILRESPFGRVWCHLGGRVQRGETLSQALQRHALDTLSVSLDLPVDPQPSWVYQWFPPDLVPIDGSDFGTDPRKHAIGLSYTVSLSGIPTPRNEALEFEFFAPDDLPEPLWPGCRELIARLV